MDRSLSQFTFEMYGSPSAISALNPSLAIHTFSLLVLAGRAVDAAGAVGGGAAPDALVAAGAVAVLARGGVYAA